MRSMKKGFTPAELCPTPKVTAAGLFTALTAPEDATSVKFARPAMELQQVSSTSAKWVVAFQQSDDGETWPASTATPSLFAGATMAAQNAEGTYYSAAAGDGFEAVTLTKRYVRWGIWALNNAGVATLELAQCAIRVERRSC